MIAKDGREVFVGIDVGKDRLDVHIRPRGQHLLVDNDQAGLTELGTHLAAHAPRFDRALSQRRLGAPDRDRADRAWRAGGGG